MMRVGFIGWRGMVGSVLMERMQAMSDFKFIEPVFFSTAKPAPAAPSIGRAVAPVQDAFDIDALKSLNVLVSCQGGDYTGEVHPRLRSAGWKGYWIDAASKLRMNDDAVIILDPVNMPVIENALDAGGAHPFDSIPPRSSAALCSGWSLGRRFSRSISASGRRM